MIFRNLSTEVPFKIFKDFYDNALEKGQNNIEAVCISSFSKKLNEVNARFVNMKFIINNEFIFFSNYNSPKSVEFNSHNQIATTIFWSNINVQIRMKGKIRRTTKIFNDEYFKNRDKFKNALAISSYQSALIDSYDAVRIIYNKCLEEQDLSQCPEYWGGYSFEPNYFEFWEGHDSRINKRSVFKKTSLAWEKQTIQP